MKSSKSDSIKTCDVCKETMNRRDRQPVCLPSCGHSFCRSCLIRIQEVNGEVQCPSCRCVHRHPAPADLPVNWTLMHLLDPDEEEGSNSNNASAPNTEDTKEAPNSTDGVSPPEEDNLKSKQSPNSKPTKGSSYLKWCAVGAAGVVGGVGLVAAAPLVLTGVGFGSAGITAGSWAAAWMSSSAIASGGGVIAGGAVATLQSAGAVGIGAAASAALGATGAGAGAGIGYGVTKLVGGSSNTPENSGNDSDSTSKKEKKNNDHDDNHRGGQQENQENSKSSENINKCDDEKDDSDSDSILYESDDEKDDSDSDCILYESDDIGDKLLL